ncbi:HAD domain-containing protein [Kordia jejudonensis]|uniref:HAD domain-containing protein n=1 Tax=Kordia jejudonensis TaxID=1348245 RepID=UPI000629C140|nr:HAD domain-containing protein [Kordia jejudonensis]
MLLYLDIDGVMVPANSWRKPEILEDGFPAFSTMAIKSLNKIISNTSATIVLTTSHKHTYSLNEWCTIFNRRDISIQEIGRLPKNTNHLNRKDELIRWFNASRSKDKFIIIDDDKSLNALPKNLKEKLIQTSGSVGLTDYLADEALDKIQKLELTTN